METFSFIIVIEMFLYLIFNLLKKTFRVFFCIVYISFNKCKITLRNTEYYIAILCIKISKCLS